MIDGLIMDISIAGQGDFSTIPVERIAWDNPRMSTPKEILRERLSELLLQTGKSMHALSKEIGANPGYVRDLLDPEKSSMPSAARLESLATSLGTTTDYLLGKVHSAQQPVSEVAFEPLPISWSGGGVQGLPILGTGYCDDLTVESDGEDFEVERIIIETDHVIELVERPPALWNSPDAYAIYFQGSSMDPAFEQGDMGVVDPRRPPSPGNYVVAQINDGASDDIMTVLVKRLVGVGRDHYEFEQFNPRMKFKVPRRQVTRMHRLLRMGEVLRGII